MKTGRTKIALASCIYIGNALRVVTNIIDLLVGFLFKFFA